MAEFRRPLHARIARILGRMDAKFLEAIACYFGGGTQLSLVYGEYRQSRDIDFIVSSREGIRAIRETVNSRSLGKLFKDPVTLVRDVITDRDAVRTFIVEEPAAQPIKFEIIYEGRIDVEGVADRTLLVPTLTPRCAVAEKFLANTDRGLDKTTYARDAIDLAFIALELDEKTFAQGYQRAVGAYGASVPQQFNAVLKRLEIDAAYRSECIAELMIEDPRRFREGLVKLRSFKRSLSRKADR